MWMLMGHVFVFGMGAVVLIKFLLSSHFWIFDDVCLAYKAEAEGFEME